MAGLVLWHLQYAGTVVLTGLMISPSVAVLSRYGAGTARFTYLYRFNLEYMAKDASDDKPADVVSGHAFCP